MLNPEEVETTPPSSPRDWQAPCDWQFKDGDQGPYSFKSISGYTSVSFLALSQFNFELLVLKQSEKSLLRPSSSGSKQLPAEPCCFRAWKGSSTPEREGDINREDRSWGETKSSPVQKHRHPAHEEQPPSKNTHVPAGTDGWTNSFYSVDA